MGWRGGIFGLSNSIPNDFFIIYLIEPLGGTHLETMLFTRYTKFNQLIFTGIKEAPIYLINIIKNNTNTITGRNITEILNRDK